MLALAQIDHETEDRFAIVDRTMAADYGYYIVDQGVRRVTVAGFKTYDLAFQAACKALD